MTALRDALFTQFSVGSSVEKTKCTKFSLILGAYNYILQYIQQLGTFIFMQGHSILSYSLEEGLGPK